jgi:uncharacterized coiled-coil protein SlyX
MSVVFYVVVFAVGCVVGYVVGGTKAGKKIKSQEGKIEQLTIALSDSRQEVEREEDDLSTLTDHFNMINSELADLKAKQNN